MDDPNNRKRQQLVKEIPMSPSAEETTCDSTVATSVSRHDPNNTVAADNISSRDPRILMRRQVLHLGLATSGVLSAFVVSVVPANILAGIAVVVLVWMTFMYRVLQYLQFEYQRSLRGRGIRDVLPESWYHQLVNMSFHDIMTDGSFAQEYQHFMLYFIPGISREQLSSYVDRLVPRHRHALHRPGVGHFLGDGFMRHIIGDEGLAERQDGTPRRIIPRRLELAESNDDTASRLGDDDDDDDSRLWGREPSILAEAVALVPMIEGEPSLDMSQHDGSESEDIEEDLAAEEEVVFDAVVSGAMTFMGFAMDYSRGAVAGSIARTSGRIFRVTLGLGVVSVGAGFFGIWAGFWTPQDLRTFRDTRIPTLASGDARIMLTSATLGSGITAGLFLLFGGSRSTPSPPSEKTKIDSSIVKTKKH